MFAYKRVIQAMKNGALRLCRLHWKCICCCVSQSDGGYVDVPRVSKDSHQVLGVAAYKEIKPI
jgi:hypothetical protein